MKFKSWKLTKISIVHINLVIFHTETGEYKTKYIHTLVKHYYPIPAKFCLGSPSIRITVFTPSSFLNPPLV